MLGILAGTSLLESALFEKYTPRRVATDYGEVTLHLAPENAAHGPVAFCQRHDRDGKFAPPHRVNHHANLAALKRQGVTQLLGLYSVGGLNESLHPGTLVLADDYFHPWEPATYNEGQPDGKFITPELDPRWRDRVLTVLRAARDEEPFPLVERGTYVQTRGPRFETKAEIRMLAQYGDVVGMTGAQEADLSQELELPHAMICMVDNYANGVTKQPLTFEAFKAKVKANRGTMERLMKTLLNHLAESNG